MIEWQSGPGQEFHLFLMVYELGMLFHLVSFLFLLCEMGIGQQYLLPNPKDSDSAGLKGGTGIPPFMKPDLVPPPL